MTNAEPRGGDGRDRPARPRGGRRRGADGRSSAGAKADGRSSAGAERADRSRGDRSETNRAGGGRGAGRPARTAVDRSATAGPSGSAGPGREQVQRPALPEEADWMLLDADVRNQLRSLPKSLAQAVGAHLHAAGLLLDTDPDAAHEHAVTARRLASRVAAAREAAGVTAYRSGRWPEAIAELRAYRRMSGSAQHLPLLADAERALGRPERALELAGGADREALSAEQRAELVLVVAGARRDLGQLAAALVELQGPARRSHSGQPWAARVRYAYADALLAADQVGQAREWFAAAAATDPHGDTDAAQRLLELDGVVLTDLDDGDAEDGGEADDAGPGPR